MFYRAWTFIVRIDFNGNSDRIAGRKCFSQRFIEQLIEMRMFAVAGGLIRNAGRRFGCFASFRWHYRSHDPQASCAQGPILLWNGFGTVRFVYRRFEGSIPKDEYGGGAMIVWDRGLWIRQAEMRAVGVRESLSMLGVFTSA